VVSSISAAVYDIEFNLEGYIWMALNCVFSAAYVLYMRKAIKTVEFKDLDTVYHNNLLSALLFIPVSLLSGEWSEYLTYR
jgi:GDP-mannose transporter